MNRKGFTLVEIMIVVAIIALLAAIAIPNLLTAKRTANDASAKATVRALSTAAEVFATANNGVYPANIGELTQYIASAATYCPAQTTQGFTYTCVYTAGAYSFTATPSTPGTTGSRVYVASTGGVLTDTAAQ